MRWIHRRTGPGHATASRAGEPTASPQREITPRRPRRHSWRYRRSVERSDAPSSGSSAWATRRGGQYLPPSATSQSGGKRRVHRRQDREGTIRQSYPADPDRPGRGVAGCLRRWNVPYPLHQALRRPWYRRIALYRQQVAGRSGSLDQLHPHERSVRRRCRGASTSNGSAHCCFGGGEERINSRPARLDGATKAVHVAQRCGTDRRPACHVPLPAR